MLRCRLRGPSVSQRYSEPLPKHRRINNCRLDDGIRSIESRLAIIIGALKMVITAAKQTASKGARARKKDLTQRMVAPVRALVCRSLAFFSGFLPLCLAEDLY